MHELICRLDYSLSALWLARPDLWPDASPRPAASGAHRVKALTLAEMTVSSQRERLSPSGLSTLTCKTHALVYSVHAFVTL